ncbi:hypothetical protein FQN50_005305 [Emmonsiellopsis sp. PD_5]|nr:hypothetical protein FQN50_005305 [Emmonsiellopsis sp. PD_5]
MPTQPTTNQPQSAKSSQAQGDSAAKSGAGGDKPKPTAQDFVSKGPQIPEGEMPPRVPREEIEARMKELNK